MKILAATYFITILATPIFASAADTPVTRAEYLQETAKLYAKIADIERRIGEIEKMRAAQAVMKKTVFTAQIVSSKRGSYNGNPITTLSVVLMKCVGIKCTPTPVSIVLDAEDMKSLGDGKSMQEIVSKKLKTMKVVDDGVTTVAIVEPAGDDPFADGAGPNKVPMFLGVPKK